MWGPRGLESLSEKIDFTPINEGKEGKQPKGRRRIKWPLICLSRVKTLQSHVRRTHVKDGEKKKKRKNTWKQIQSLSPVYSAALIEYVLLWNIYTNIQLITAAVMLIIQA